MRELSLDRDWLFRYGEIENADYAGYDDRSWRVVTLPHDWAVENEFSRDCSSGTGYLPAGVGWYRRHFTLTETEARQCAFLTFGGVYCNSRVYVNSNYLGKRPYGYSTFTYEITDFIRPGDNVISVKVEHTHTADSRWYTGSGITRGVTLTVTGRPHFLRGGAGLFFRTPAVTAETAEIAVDFALSGEGTASFALYDGDVCVGKAAAKGAGGTAIFYVQKPRLWSVEEPFLYTLRATVKKGRAVTDEQVLRVGLRTMTFTADKGFFLNGRPLKLKGVCLHHDAGALGAAVPKEVWARRLAILKEGGCNAVRTSHNPPDPALLDLCDERGFVVMDEAFDEWEGCKNKWWHGHNVYPPKHHGYSTDFPAWHERDLTDFVLRDRNHPCVALWSIGNEIDYPNDPYVHPDFTGVRGNNDAGKPDQERVYDKDKPDARRLATVGKELAAIVHRCDPTRPVTAALAFPEMSEAIGLTDVLDVVGYNYRENLYAGDHERVPQRILLGSENGHGADAWRAVRDNEYIGGQFLWTGVDYLGEAAGWPVRASGAGLLDLAGFPKPRYYYHKAMWCDKLTAALTATGQDGRETFGWNFAEKEEVTVVLYTNADEAELFLNGESFGAKRPARDGDGYRVEWRIPFAEGHLRAVCRRGNERTSVGLTTAGPAAAVSIDLTKYSDDGFYQAVIELQDRNGRPAAGACEIAVGADGAQLCGIENGDIADLTPYYRSLRRTVGGRVIAYLRPDEGATAFTVTAEAEKNVVTTATVQLP